MRADSGAQSRTAYVHLDLSPRPVVLPYISSLRSARVANQHERDSPASATKNKRARGLRENPASKKRTVHPIKGAKRTGPSTFWGPWRPMLGPSWPYPRVANGQATLLSIVNSIRQIGPRCVFSRDADHSEIARDSPASASRTTTQCSGPPMRAEWTGSHTSTNVGANS